MITLIKNGLYRLIETRQQNKILYLDDEVYAWVQPPKFGEMLVATHRPHKTDCILSVGEYCLYSATDEHGASPRQRLELEVGDGIWQGYLLLRGLPTDVKPKVRIVPTHEHITDDPEYSTLRYSVAATGPVRTPS